MTGFDLRANEDDFYDDEEDHDDMQIDEVADEHFFLKSELMDKDLKSKNTVGNERNRLLLEKLSKFSTNNKDVSHRF